MKRKQLITPYPLEDDRVLGITAGLKAYKLAWLINQAASLKLTQAPDWCCHITGQPPSHGLHFLFATEHCSFRLVKNGLLSSEGALVGYLLPTLRYFDFFFTVQDPTATFQSETFCTALKATNKVIYVAHLLEEGWRHTDLVRVLGC